MLSGRAAALPDMVKSMGRAFSESAFVGWRETAESIPENTQLIVPAALIMAVCLAVGWRDDQDELPSRLTAVLAFGAGIGAVVLAFAPFLPQPLRSGNET